MARSLGDAIPDPIRPLFDAADLAAREGLTFLLMTTTVDGWPHLAMLSVGEVLAVSQRELRLALWPNSTATANLSLAGRATLSLVHDGAGYSLRCSARREAALQLADDGPLASFSLHVEEAFEDRAPYAELTTGVRYRLRDRDPVLARWHRTIAALRRGRPAC